MNFPKDKYSIKILPSSQITQASRIKRTITQYQQNNLLYFQQQNLQTLMQTIEKSSQLAEDYYQECHKDQKRLCELRKMIINEFFHKNRGVSAVGTLPLKVEQQTQRRFAKTAIQSRKNISICSSIQQKTPKKVTSTPLQFKRTRTLNKTQYLQTSNNILNCSQKEARYHDFFQQKRRNIQTPSDKKKKHKKLMLSEKNQILQYIELDEDKQEHLKYNEKKQMYSIDFVEYLKKKSNKRLRQDFFQKKQKVKETKCQKFQQFILQYVKFPKRTKQKLQNYFIKMNRSLKKT